MILFYNICGCTAHRTPGGFALILSLLLKHALCAVLP